MAQKPVFKRLSWPNNRTHVTEFGIRLHFWLGLTVWGLSPNAPRELPMGTPASPRSARRGCYVLVTQCKHLFSLNNRNPWIPNLTEKFVELRNMVGANQR